MEHDKLSQPEISGDLKSQALWTFFTNHGHVLIALAKDPDITLRDIAESVGITERAVHKIISELEEGGYLTRIRVGRKNQYKLSVDRPLRHPLESHRSVGDVIRLILTP